MFSKCGSGLNLRWRNVVTKSDGAIFGFNRSSDCGLVQLPKEISRMQQKVKTLAINSAIKIVLKYQELKYLFKRVNDSKLMD